MIKNDKWITKMATEHGMISPFVPELVREVKVSHQPPNKVISFGLSSYGYDIRLSPKEFRVFSDPGQLIDPKDFKPSHLGRAKLHQNSAKGDFFVLPAHGYGLGVALEVLDIPDGISVLCVGKSTYARCGVIANLTPAESGWRGHLTLEFSNSSSSNCRIYANEGIVQLLFFGGDPCDISYDDRKGKYQDQEHEVTLARI